MRRQKKQYSEEFKESILQKVLESPKKSYSSIALEVGIPKTTLYQWLKKSGNISKQKKSITKWKSKDKLQALKDVSTLTEIEKSEYCRKKGIYISDIKKWEKQFSETDISKLEELNNLKEALDESKNKIKQLEKDNRRKEKALAETAALLVLRKKAEAIWGDPEAE